MGMVTSFVFAVGGANRYLSFENHVIKEFNVKMKLNLSKNENDINLFYPFCTIWFLADDQMAGQLLESDVHSFQLYFFHILNYLSRNQEKPQFWI